MELHDDQKSLAWQAVSAASGALAALAVRKLIGLLWSAGRGNEAPPNPADHRIDWKDALAWSAAAGAGAGVSRVLGQRAAATGWEAATGSQPPGLTTDESPWV